MMHSVKSYVIGSARPAVHHAQYVSSPICQMHLNYLIRSAYQSLIGTNCYVVHMLTVLFTCLYLLMPHSVCLKQSTEFILLDIYTMP